MFLRDAGTVYEVGEGGGGGGERNRRIKAKHTCLSPQKNFEFHTTVMTGNASKYYEPHIDNKNLNVIEKQLSRIIIYIENILGVLIG